METTLRSSLKAALALGAVAITMLLTVLSVSPTTAQAGENHYCWGSWVGPKNYCYSDGRWFNAVFGQGQQGTVCVGWGSGEGWACSGGPAPKTVYQPVGSTIWGQAWIHNAMSNQNNQVYGITFTP